MDYEPAESSTGLFGGNSNWRGPIWFPVNYLLIESLQKFHHYPRRRLQSGMSDRFRSDDDLNLGIAGRISRRLTRIFLRRPKRRRPSSAAPKGFKDPHWRDLIPFYEYFHGDNGAGIGASHQTGWTALVAKLIQQSGEWGA